MTDHILQRGTADRLSGGRWSSDGTPQPEGLRAGARGAAGISAGDVPNTPTGEDETLAIGASTILAESETITVAPGSTVVIDGAAQGVTIDFADATGTVELLDPLEFQGSISGFVTGDTLDLVNTPSETWSYNANNGTLAIYNGNGSSDNPLAAQFQLTSDVPLSTQQIFVGSDGHGGSLILLSTARNWFGGDGAWFDSANWSTTGTVVPNSYPLLGDTAIINAGTATITAADFVTAGGTLDDENILLSGDGAGLNLSDGVLGPDLSLYGTASQASLSLTIEGTVSVEGLIAASGDNATLALDVGAAGTQAGDLIISETGTLSISNESAVTLATGRMTNDGQILDSGALTVAAGATLDGSGVIDLGDTFNQLTLTVAGTVGAGQQVAFSYDRLNIAQGARFDGTIEDFANGDTIDLQGVSADYVSYDTATSDLIVRNGGAGGEVVATLAVAGNYGANDFALASDGDGGVLVTDTVTNGARVFYTVLPTPAVLEPGQSISLADLLVASFGSAALSLPDVQLWSQSAADMGQFSYWDPSDPSLPYWTWNGTIVTPDNLETIPQSAFDEVYYVAGNAIQANGIVQVPLAFDAEGTADAYTDYAIQNFAAAFAQPSLDSGAPSVNDIVNAASAFAAAYSGVANTNDCFNIAHEVAAAAGATMVEDTGSTDPEHNVAGGFWRIAYAAPQNGTAVDNWGSLVQAGDIVRVGWDRGGEHSFTVLAPLNNAGSITVFDNADWSEGYEAIGIHQVTYWNATNPDDITIFRLDPNDLYLVDTTAGDGKLIQNVPSATVFGTNFDDLIIPAGIANTIVLDGGNDIIADTAAILNDATLNGFGSGDTIDLTDLDNSTTAVKYDATTGVLDVMSSGSQVAELFLPTGLDGDFNIDNDGGSLGLDGDTLGTLYSSLFTGASEEGSAVTFVTCFAAGTLIATPEGEVPVETLSIGDRVLCVDGKIQPIMWIGRRAVDLARHPEPHKVLPVKVAAHAFGRGRPARDLWLSPDHAIFAEGVLIPVRYLVNGLSVVQETVQQMRQVRYFHIELPAHDVLLAEGLAVESYLDAGNRNSFSNGGSTVTLFPDFAPLIWEAQGYAPLRVVGPEVDRLRARLDARATTGQRRRQPGR